MDGTNWMGQSRWGLPGRVRLRKAYLGGSDWLGYTWVGQTEWARPGWSDLVGHAWVGQTEWARPGWVRQSVLDLSGSDWVGQTWMGQTEWVRPGWVAPMGNSMGYPTGKKSGPLGLAHSLLVGRPGWFRLSGPCLGGSDLVGHAWVGQTEWARPGWVAPMGNSMGFPTGKKSVPLGLAHSLLVVLPTPS